jgi:tetratricopeptide (TPR) repeat protein
VTAAATDSVRIAQARIGCDATAEKESGVIVAVGLVSLGLVRFARHDFPHAIPFLRRALTEVTSLNQPFSASTINHLLGDAYIGSGQLQPAIAALNAATGQNSRNAGAYADLSLARLRTGDFDAARADANQAIQIRPKDAIAYTDRAEADNALGDVPGALADYRKAIALNSHLTAPHVGRAQVLYFEVHDARGALKDLSDASHINPVDPRPYWDSGYIHFHLGDWRRAVDDYTNYLRIKPRIEDGLRRRGLALFNAGDTTRALNDLRQAVALDPKDAQAYRGLGEIQLERRDWSEAIRDFGAYLQIKPGAEDGLRRRGLALFFAGDSRRAIADYKHIDPEDALGYLERGYVKFSMRLMGKAIQDFSWSIGVDPINPLAFVARSQTYEALGDTLRAAEDCSTARYLLHRVGRPRIVSSEYALVEQMIWSGGCSVNLPSGSSQSEATLARH